MSKLEETGVQCAKCWKWIEEKDSHSVPDDLNYYCEDCCPLCGKKKETEREMSHNKESCKTCKFYDHGDFYPEDGECKRYPPILFKNDDGGYSSLWPDVGENSWCGEYQEKRE